MTDRPWDVIVPLKNLTTAKTRLRLCDPELRYDLVRAMSSDTVEAVLQSMPSITVHVVTDDETLAGDLALLGNGVTVHRGSPPGLNEAVSFGLAEVRRRAAGHRVAAILGDLPAMRPTDLTEVLEQAGAVPRSVVADRSGHGCTFLAATGNQPLHPQFGRASFARHVSSGAVPLTAENRIRCDVDDLADLCVAQRLGLRPRTAALAELHGLSGTRVRALT